MDSWILLPQSSAPAWEPKRLVPQVAERPVSSAPGLQQDRGVLRAVRGAGVLILLIRQLSGAPRARD